MVGLVHALSHALGAICHVPHGIANAIMLPFGMEYNLEKCEEYIAEILLPFVGPEEYTLVPHNEKARRVITEIRKLAKELSGLCGLPLNLRDAGVPKDKLEEIAKATLNDGAVVFNPGEISKEEALEVLEKAYK
jgi:alcohol dehydrogenase